MSIFHLWTTASISLPPTAPAISFLPVQVKYKIARSGFSLSRSDVEKFKAANAVVAFGVQGANGTTDYWFFPIAEWCAHCEDRNRGDDKLVVYWSNDDRASFNPYLNGTGIERAFSSLR